MYTENQPFVDDFPINNVILNIHAVRLPEAVQIFCSYWRHWTVTGSQKGVWAASRPSSVWAYRSSQVTTWRPKGMVLLKSQQHFCRLVGLVIFLNFGLKHFGWFFLVYFICVVKPSEVNASTTNCGASWRFWAFPPRRCWPAGPRANGASPWGQLPRNSWHPKNELSEHFFQKICGTFEDCGGAKPVCFASKSHSKSRWKSWLQVLQRSCGAFRDSGRLARQGCSPAVRRPGRRRSGGEPEHPFPKPFPRMRSEGS